MSKAITTNTPTWTYLRNFILFGEFKNSFEKNPDKSTNKENTVKEVRINKNPST